jgi:ERCC4-related helicase
MKWPLSSTLTLDGAGVEPDVVARQTETAAEILRRFERTPGQILADEVGMGKTFVALAVAASVIEATNGGQVVVMVPTSVGEKWPREWRKFHRGRASDIRAVEGPVRRASDFLKLLDDPPERRTHLIVLTHGALTSQLNDPLLKLAILRRAMLWVPRLARQRRVLPRWAGQIVGGAWWDEELTRKFLDAPTTHWRRILRAADKDPGDDPVPEAFARALESVDMTNVRGVLERLPLRSGPRVEARLAEVRRELQAEFRETWALCLRRLDVRLPLLILDEAHHAKNRHTRLASLFASSAQADATALKQGELSDIFERMLFLTATPFQLGHHELLEVLRRFEGIRWDGLDRADYAARLEALSAALDAARASALRLERQWGRIDPERVATAPGDWWQDPDTAPEHLRAAAVSWRDAERHAREAEQRLRPFVIRHVRADRATRRTLRPGDEIRDAGTATGRGLPIDGPAVLPFLLAARAQALIGAFGLRERREARAVFADGLASSFEAYRHTRIVSDGEEVADDREDVASELPHEVRWYLDRISAALPDDGPQMGSHPKIAATVERAVALWERREKVLIFCFYRATGAALRRQIAQSITTRALAIADERLGTGGDLERAQGELERVRRSLEPSQGGRSYHVAHELTVDALSPHLAAEELEIAASLCVRFLRTSSFLVRYVDLSRPLDDALREAFARRDASGRSFRDVVQAFGRFIASREGSERDAYIQDLRRLDVGEIQVRDDDGTREGLSPAVRLANGGVGQEVRQRLMLAFNTPFFPDVLVASSVMAEGVDLHLNCRHVIHHDLAWNPSTIEQRTGRLDRIGSKGEVTGLPIQVFEPFLEGTQDEKVFRVMKDRERWFNVVMGERLELDEWQTDAIANRVPLPLDAAEPLGMDLSVWRPGSRPRRGRG